MRVMNTSSSDAVVRLTNVVANAIAQFQAGQQHPAQSDQSSLAWLDHFFPFFFVVAEKRVW